MWYVAVPRDVVVWGVKFSVRTTMAALACASTHAGADGASDSGRHSITIVPQDKSAFVPEAVGEGLFPALRSSTKHSYS